MTVKWSTIFYWMLGIFSYDLLILPILQHMDLMQGTNRKEEVSFDIKMTFLLAVMWGICYLRRGTVK